MGVLVEGLGLMKVVFLLVSCTLGFFPSSHIVFIINYVFVVCFVLKFIISRWAECLLLSCIGNDSSMYFI